MASQSEQYDVAVVGGGVIGLAVAWRAAQRGLRTLVLDAGEDGAWRYAAGMLAPVTEAGVRRAASCSTSACARSPGSPTSAPSSAVRAATRLRLTGTLVVARDRDEAEELEQLYAYRQKLGLAVERLRPSQARRAEPALAPTVRLALDVPGDGAVDPRRLVAALSDAVEAAGGEIRRERVTDPATLPARQVVIAAGAWSGKLGALPVRPVKGQIMRLRDPQRRGPRHAHHPHPRGLPRAARRGPLRARRDGRGARLGHRADRRRHARADPRPRRGRARRARARDRGAGRRPAPRHARQPAGRSARRAG